MEIRSFAETFVTLQDKRHEADYALDAKPYRKSDAITEIDAAELAINQFEQSDHRGEAQFPRLLHKLLHVYVTRRRSVLREHVGALFRVFRCCSWRGSTCRQGEQCARRIG